jgi:hypothetical protein
LRKRLVVPQKIKHRSLCQWLTPIQGLKPAWANSSREPILKNPSQNRAGGMAQKPFKPQNHTQKKKIKHRITI